MKRCLRNHAPYEIVQLLIRVGLEIYETGARATVSWMPWLKLKTGVRWPASIKQCFTMSTREDTV